MEKFIYSFVFWYKPKFKHVSCKGSVKRLIKNACRVNRKEGMSLNSIKARAWCVTEASEMRQDRLAIAFDQAGSSSHSF